MSDEGQVNRSQLLEEVIRAVGVELRCGLPGVVTKVESEDPPVVEVLPLIHRHGVTDKEKPIPGVPVKTRAGGGAVISLPTPKKKDLVWLSVADRELDGWIAGKGTTETRAAEDRTHDPADVVAEPMTITSLPSGATGKLHMSFSSSKLEMESDGDVVLEAADDLEAKGATATMEGNTAATVKAGLGKLTVDPLGLVALGNSTTGVELVAKVIALIDVLLTNKDDFVILDSQTGKYKLQTAVVAALDTPVTGLKQLLQSIKGSL